MKFISDEHAKRHNVIAVGIKRYDEFMKGEYNAPADETPAMREALAWYDKMVGSLAGSAGNDAAAEDGVGIAALRAEVESFRTALEAMRKEHAAMDHRTKMLAEFFGAYRDHVSQMHSAFGRWTTDEHGTCMRYD